MPSPYRKPNAHGHRRRGLDDRRELDTPKRKAPPLPRGNTWPPHIRKWWREVWVHPVSEDWDSVADFAVVARLATMYASIAAGSDLTAAMLAQVVRLETELLLTPAARKRAYVRLPAGEPKGAERSPRPGPGPAPGRRSDPRNVLRADFPPKLA